MTTHQFDAYAALEKLRDRYARYLLDAFGVRSTALSEMLLRHWTDRGDNPFPLLGPTLIQAGFPYQTERPLADLCAGAPADRTPERPLHPRTVQALGGSLGFDLFAHQVTAIRAASFGKTTVLSAGTGSGKTEAFLVSAIDALHWAEERGEDNLEEPGVRAIVVYPLNALVNNQIDRMQQLLAKQTRLRFAFYTSRLPETFRRAESWYTDRGLPLPPQCQLLDRRTVRGIETPPGRLPGPPHILVTNFSMLEYMLIRPLDRSFFLPERLFHKGKPRLRVVVLDEAHVYAGAQATEIHMLLRRAALRFGTTLDAVQGIATSATLAQGADDAAQREALRLYGAKMFAKVPEDVEPVLAAQVMPAVDGSVRDGRIVAPSQRDLVPGTMRTLEFDGEGRPVALVIDEASAGAVAQACLSLSVCTSADVDRIPSSDRHTPALVAWHLLSGHATVRTLRERLHGSTGATLPTLDTLATAVFGAAGDDERRAMDALLRLGAVARRSAREHPLIPTRMHVWLRAPAGVWAAPEPESGTPRLHESWHWGALCSSPPNDAQTASTRYEVIVCNTCGREYLLGYRGSDSWGNETYSGLADENSAPIAFAAAPESSEALPWGSLRGHRVELHHDSRKRLTGACAHCKDANARFGKLQLNPRYALGAIVDGIYPFLAEHSVGPHQPERPTAAVHRPGGGRRLLTFSDSRQEAARVAHDVEASHNVGLNRAVLYRALLRCGVGETTPISELVPDLANDPALLQRAEAAAVTPMHRENIDFKDQLATLGIYQELARPAVDAPTLEGLGLVEVVYPRLPPAPADCGLSQQEWQMFLASVLDIARAQGAVARPAITMDEDLKTRLPRFTGRPIVLTASDDHEEAAEQDERRRQRIPLLGRPTVSRIAAYADTVAKRSGASAGGGERLLHCIWKALEELSRSTRWLSFDSTSKGYLIKLGNLALRAHDAPKFVEPLSGRLFARSVQRVAPVGARPFLDLRALTEEEKAVWQARHAVRRVVGDELLGLSTIEHTAQIDVDELDQAERNFRAGTANVLACSTTMEMGVDLGGLTLVLMTNVPPAAANYWQRAGRAGRRADGTSLALSLAQQRPHDQKVFDRPHEFLGEPMVPPQVRFDLPALLIRHINAFLLTVFFHEAVAPTAAGNPMRAFGTVGEFFASPVIPSEIRESILALEAEPRSLADVFVAWLDSLDGVGATARGLEALVRGTVLAGRTIGELADGCRDAISRVAVDARGDLASIDAQRLAETERGAGAADRQLLNALRHQEKTIKSELLIAHLAKSDVLPRFGFPLDVVRLETKWRVADQDSEANPDREQNPGLRMERDLKIALSEYVPGTKVLAGKRLHRSSGLIPNWRADEKSQVRVSFYVHCGNCGYLEPRRTTDPDGCVMCGHAVGRTLQDAPRDRETELGPTPIRQYLVPSSFAVKLGDRPERPDTFASSERMPPAFVFVSSAGPLATHLEVCEGIQVVFEPSTTIAFRSEGRLAESRRRGYGYAVCQRCGRAEPEEGWDRAPPTDVQPGHAALRGGSRCGGDNLWRHMALGTWSLVDTLRFRLSGALAPTVRHSEQEDFFLSLAVSLQELVGERLRVERRTLSTAVGTWKDAAGEVHREAIVWDPSTSGMLEHLLPHAGELVTELVKKLDLEPDLLSYVRFDNQFMVADGTFRLDLLRSHFLDTVRRQHLPQVSGVAVPTPGAVRQEPLRSLAVQAFDISTRPVLLAAPRLGPDAFGVDGLMRIAHAMALREPDSIRLLIGAVPRPDVPEETALAGALADLIAAGAEVRKASDHEVFASFPRILYTARGSRRALGGVRRHGGRWTPTEICFGSDWGRGLVTLENAGAAAEKSFIAFDSAWTSAAKVGSEVLIPKPSSGLHYVSIRQGSGDALSTSFAPMLADKIGKLAEVGTVKQLLYVDRYLASSAIATWNLFRALEAFTYAKDARVVARCLIPRGGMNRELETIFRGHPRDPLSPREMDRFGENLKAKRGAVPVFDYVLDREAGGEQMRHGRKLLVAFAGGGRLRTLKVELESGMDWIFPNSTRNWPASSLTAKQTHFVIVENYDFEHEKDVRGRSEWAHLFG